MAGQDPVLYGALKIWTSETLRNILLAPSPILYFDFLNIYYPAIMDEIRHVPKMAIFGALDEVADMPKRKKELVSAFERFGNIKVIILEGNLHDLDSSGHKHNLYMNPVFTKYVYDFFMMLSQS